MFYFSYLLIKKILKNINLKKFIIIWFILYNKNIIYQVFFIWSLKKNYQKIENSV